MSLTSIACDPDSDVDLAASVALSGTTDSSAMVGSVSDSQPDILFGILAINRNIAVSVRVNLATAMFAHFQQRFVALAEPGEAFIYSLHPVVHLSIGNGSVGLILCLIQANISHALDDDI